MSAIEYIVHSDPSGRYWADVPSIPGCVTEADTPEELAFMVKDACAAVWRSIKGMTGISRDELRF